MSLEVEVQKRIALSLSRRCLGFSGTKYSGSLSHENHLELLEAAASAATGERDEVAAGGHFAASATARRLLHPLIHDQEVDDAPMEATLFPLPQLYSAGTTLLAITPFRPVSRTSVSDVTSVSLTVVILLLYLTTRGELFKFESLVLN